MFSTAKGISSLTTSFAITLTLKPHVRKLTAEVQYDKYVSHILKQFEEKFTHLSLVTLVCELTKSYDLHFHGTIKFSTKILGKYKNIARFFADAFRQDKIIGYVLLKPITDERVWHAYLGKTLKEFNEDICREPIIKNDFLIDFSEYEWIDSNGVDDDDD